MTKAMRTTTTAIRMDPPHTGELIILIDPIVTTTGGDDDCLRHCELLFAQQILEEPGEHDYHRHVGMQID